MTKPALVIDSSVWGCAFLNKKDAPERQVEAARSLDIVRNFQMVGSTESLAETKRLLDRRQDGGAEVARLRQGFRKLIDLKTKLVTPRAAPVRCKDRDDQVFLDAARGGRASVLLTDDEDLWSLRKSGNAIIIRPAQFNRLFGQDPKLTKVHITKNQRLLKAGVLNDTVILDKQQALLLHRLGNDYPVMQNLRQGKVEHSTVLDPSPSGFKADKGSRVHMVVSDLLAGSPRLKGSGREHDIQFMTPAQYGWCKKYPDDSLSRSILPYVHDLHKSRTISLVTLPPPQPSPKPTVRPGIVYPAPRPSSAKKIR